MGRKILWRNEEDARVNRSGVQADSRNFSRSPRGGRVRRQRQDGAKFVKMLENIHVLKSKEPFQLNPLKNVTQLLKSQVMKS